MDNIWEMEKGEGHGERKVGQYFAIHGLNVGNMINNMWTIYGKYMGIG